MEKGKSIGKLNVNFSKHSDYNQTSVTTASSERATIKGSRLGALTLTLFRKENKLSIELMIEKPLRRRFRAVRHFWYFTGPKSTCLITLETKNKSRGYVK
jgi:hypothetical protein